MLPLTDVGAPVPPYASRRAAAECFQPALPHETDGGVAWSLDLDPASGRTLPAQDETGDVAHAMRMIQTVIRTRSLPFTHARDLVGLDRRHCGANDGVDR